MTRTTDLKIAAAREILARRRARLSLHDFITYLRPDYIASDFSRSVCAALDQFVIDMQEGRRPVLCLAAPPQHGKSEIVSRYLPSYLFGLDPNLRIGGISYGSSLARAMNKDVQAKMMSSQYRNVFPNTRLNDRRVALGDDLVVRNTEEFGIVGHRGYYVAQGVGGPLTGKSLDVLIIDDPIKNAQEALSRTVKESLWSWYTSTAMSRMSANSGQIIMATRWALDDLTGRVLDHYDRAVDLRYQAISDDGKALIPQLHSLEKLLEYKKIFSDYFFSAMYQQNPIAETGGDFETDKIEIIEAAPAGLEPVRGWDLAASKHSGDWTAGVKLAIKDGLVYVLDVVHMQENTHEVMQRIQSVARADQCMQDFPQDPGSAGKMIVSWLAQNLHGETFRSSTESGSKIVRAMPFSAQVNAGNVRMVRGKWNSAFIDELATFPLGSHDDIVDAASRAYNHLALVGRSTGILDYLGD